jgi:ABC-type phosphate transport system permease subunit
VIVRVLAFVLAVVVALGAAVVIAETVPADAQQPLGFVVGLVLAIAWVLTDRRLAEDELPPFA